MLPRLECATPTETIDLYKKGIYQSILSDSFLFCFALIETNEYTFLLIRGRVVIVC